MSEKLLDGYPYTIEELTEAIEGSLINEGADKPDDSHGEDSDRWECDWCSKNILYSAEKRVASYLCDRIPHNVTQAARDVNANPWPATMGTYCDECSADLLLFPCRGYTEIRFLSTIAEDKRHRDVEITDVSPRHSGIPWDPVEVQERLFQRPIEDLVHPHEGVAMAPENIVTSVTSIGDECDIRQLVDYNGEIDEKQLGRARKQAKGYGHKRASQNFDRKAFRDHVRDG